MPRVGSILLLLILAVLWLFPEWFGLTNGNPTRTVDGATVIARDGDTLTAAGQDYRLHGIDAPEYAQTCKTATGADWRCGKVARDELAAIVKGRTLVCEERARDKYGRIVATCTDDQGRDVARAMIDRGLAVSFGGFADGPYASDEVIAKGKRHGLWQGTFEAPSSWRATHPRAPVATR